MSFSMQIKKGKKYGLVPANEIKKNVFASSSTEQESSEELTYEEQKRKAQLEIQNDQKRKQEKWKEEQERLQAQDPTVYQFDELISETKVDKKTVDKGPAKPRYIQNIIKTVQERKIESEIIREQVQKKKAEKENQELGIVAEQKFVTGAFLKKQQEREQWKLMDEQREAKNVDVTTRTDLTGIYGSIINTLAGEGNTPPSIPHPKHTSPDKPTTPNSSNETQSEDRKSQLKEYLETRIVPHETSEETEARLKREAEEKQEQEQKKKEMEQLELQKYAKRSDDKTVEDARARFLARKKMKQESEQ